MKSNLIPEKLFNSNIFDCNRKCIVDTMFAIQEISYILVARKSIQRSMFINDSGMQKNITKQCCTNGEGVKGGKTISEVNIFLVYFFQNLPILKSED